MHWHSLAEYPEEHPWRETILRALVGECPVEMVLVPKKYPPGVDKEGDGQIF